MTSTATPSSQSFASESEYRAAIDGVIASAQRELCIFDQDLSRLRFEERDRAALLEQFLSASAARRLRVVLRSESFVPGPRVQGLFGRHAAAIELRRTPDALTHLADCLVLADGRHGVIRFHFDHARGKGVTENEGEIEPQLKRFEELWELSEPCVLGAPIGL